VKGACCFWMECRTVIVDCMGTLQSGACSSQSTQFAPSRTGLACAGLARAWRPTRLTA